MENILIKGNNIDGLRFLLEEKELHGKIDLVYIDPPFATNDIFLVSKDRRATISRSSDGEIAYTDKMLGDEYLFFLEQRLVLLKDLLSYRGSIYLHIDYKIGHYVKILMDKVFGINNFRNDITRIKCNPKNFHRIGYGNIKDLILYYSKQENPIWNEPIIPYTDEDIQRLFPKIDEKGRRYTTVPLHAPGETINGRTKDEFKGLKPPVGRHWRTDVETLNLWDEQGIIEWSSKGNPRKKIYADQKVGKRRQDVWEFKDPQYPHYPTEKNVKLLESIISTSSNPNSYVLDCFSGSGTTLVAAQKLGRNWIGIDNSDFAINITIERIHKLQAKYTSNQQDFEYIEII